LGRESSNDWRGLGKTSSSVFESLAPKHSQFWIARRLSACIIPATRLVVHRQPTSPQFRRDAPVSVPFSMFQCNLLNGRAYFHGLLDRRSGLKMSAESRSAHFSQLAHPLDTQAALQ
jgi:hypothetical protein